MKSLLLILSFLIYSVVSAGIPEELFTVFPNPTSSGYFTLKFEQNNQNYAYSLFDFTGNEIISGKANSDFEKEVFIDVSAFPEGNYFLIVNNGKDRLTKKITIKD